jgi:hypothetical protein
MPRERWLWMCPFIGMTYFTFLQSRTSYEDFNSLLPISELEWLIGLSTVALIILGLVYWSLRKARKGTVTASGIGLESGSFIPYAFIDKIVREGDGFPSTVFTENGDINLHIADGEFAKLARTSLNQWAVKAEKVTVTAGEPGQTLRISYKPRGKYCTYRLGKQESIILFVLCALLPIKIFFELELAMVTLVAGLGFFLFFYFPIIYRKNGLSVIGDTILLKDENSLEHRLQFGDIAGIKQSIFRVKVTTKDGRTLYFPQGFVLLPELIGEFASERPSSPQ